MNKGISQSLEAVIAILMIMTIFVISYRQTTLPEFETVSWKLKGFDSLKVLDENNELREYALANNTLAIKERLQSLLPSYLEYEIVVCDESCPVLNIESEKLVTVSYIISGDTNTFNPKQIFLYMW